METISFDRASDFYDKTRGFPPEVTDQIIGSLLKVIPSDAKIVDIGIGTGRISIPLLTHYCSITGIDISEKMMRRLKAALPENACSPDLIQANALYLPIVNHSFDIAISVHVLHLIEDLPAAIQEITRILKPKGQLIIGHRHRTEGSPRSRIHTRFNEILSDLGHKRHRANEKSLEYIKEYLMQTGATFNEWIAGTWVTRQSINDYIMGLEQKVWSSTWEIPDSIYPVAMRKLKNWAEEKYGYLDQGFDLENVFIWQSYEIRE